MTFKYVTATFIEQVGAAFSVKLPPRWNALPLEVVTAQTLDAHVGRPLGLSFLRRLVKATAKFIYYRGTLGTLLS